MPPPRQPPPKPGPPPPKGAAKTPRGAKKKRRDFGGFKVQDALEYEAHAKEVKQLAAGKDFVERQSPEREKRPAPFDRKELGVVRSWVARRPLESAPPAAALIDFPRLWNTKRGRYVRFRAPGGLGSYALLRARPTF
jgi:hypothetical protein